MKNFLTDSFLLGSRTGKRYYDRYAKDLPILDYHCHIPPGLLLRNEPFRDISELWLGGDHYKWRLMRLCGIEERRVTGNASGREKFIAWAKTLERCPGNPLYHWSHMELQTYFGCDELITSERAEAIYDHCSRIMADGHFTPRSILEISRVKLICTTDDPADSLDGHLAIREDPAWKTAVLPTYRPDRTVNIKSPAFPRDVRELCLRRGTDPDSLAGLVAAHDASIAVFRDAGCRLADLGLNRIPYSETDEETASGIFLKVMAGAAPDDDETDRFVTWLLRELAARFARENWVMQLHIGAQRNVNTGRYRRMGPDTGYDSISPATGMDTLAMFLDSLDRDDRLPKTILYSLHPGDDALIDTLCGCFTKEGVRGAVQHGIAWWFNDTLSGIRDHLTRYASLGVLGNHPGMLTDSRSLLSYVRHDYFRRILCDLLGSWEDSGLMAMPEDQAARMIHDICCGNISEMLGLSPACRF